MDNTLEEVSPSVKTISSVQYLQCTFTQMNLQWIYLMLNEIPHNIHSTNVQLFVQKTSTNIKNMQQLLMKNRIKCVSKHMCLTHSFKFNLTFNMYTSIIYTHLDITMCSKSGN